MINKEILEIKKLLNKAEDSSIRLCGCYVAGEEKKKLTYINDYLSNMPDEDQHKFVEILKKSLSGTIGKNLYNLEFASESESDEDCQQKSLLLLRDSELKSEEILDNYYDFVIEKLDFVGNYLILVMYDEYNVPVKTKDNLKLDDSVEVFRYIISCICPVNLSKPALSYHEDTNSIENRNRDWVVEPPCLGFMFPAFNDRSADIHSLLYYVKSVKNMYGEFIKDALGCNESVPTEFKKQIFNDIIEDVVLNQPDIEVVDVVRNINDNLREMVENNNDDYEVVLNKQDVKNLLNKSGVDESVLEKVDQKYEKELGEDMEFSASDIQETRKFEVKTNDVTINVKPENSGIVKIKMIDGMKCLVIPMDDSVEINGIISKVREKLEENV